MDKIFPVVFGLVLAGLFLGLITFTSDSAEGEGLADTPWPCYRGNLNNTALSPYNTSLINGTLKWSFSTGGWVYSSPSIGSDGTIYFGSDDQNFYALYPNGTLKWSFLTGDWVRSSPAIATDGTIYFISYDRYFYALYPNGTLKWTYPIVGWVPYSPTIDNNGIIYFGTSHVDDKLYALYPNGTLKWTFKTEHDVSSKPVIGTDGIIYFCSLDENIYALYPNGTLKWSHNSNPIYDSPAISQDGIIYFGTSSGEFFALYLNGTEKWNITIGECVQSSCAIDADGIIYVGSYDNNLYALYPNSTVKWTFLTGDNVISCPSIGADGTIYFGSNDHNIYALYPNGMLKWNYTTGDWIWGSPTIGGDGNIYVPSKDGNLYAFGSTFAPPSAPQNLQAIAGNGYVKLTWDPPIFEGSFPITNYTIYRGTASGSEIFLIEVGNVTNYNDTSVLNGIRYYYIVKARNIVGDGPFSNEVDAMPIGWPSTPQDLQTSSGDSYIDLDWSAPITDGGGPITNYRIYKGTSPGALTFYVELGDVQFYHDIVVTNGITYYYKVSAVNNLGEGPLSNEASATPGTVPEAPLNLQAAAGNRYVNLSWDEPSYDGGFPIINYTIYRGTVSSGEEFLLEIGNLTNYNDTNVENCIRYYYKVKAKNALGEGAFSNEANDVPLGPPLDPQNLSAESGDSYVYLTWDAPESDGGSSITNYRIYRGTTSDEVALFMEIGDVQFFNDTNVTNRITYYYNVSAVNGIGEGLLSNETNATPASNLTAPQNLQANAGDGFVNLTWDPPASDGDFSIINYSIYKGTTSDDEIFYIEIQNVTYYEDTNVLNGIRYYYKVKAKNVLEEGPFSNEADDMPRGTPSAPQDLLAQGGDSYVILTWDPPILDGGLPITNYMIYRGTTPGEIAPFKTIGTVLFYNDTSVSNGITYYYKVSAVNSFGEGDLSDEVNDTPSALPTAPQKLHATAGDEYVNLTWEAPSSDGGFPITNYIIYRGETSGSETFHMEIQNVLYYNDTDVINGIRYYYKVSTKTTFGEGSQSNEADDIPLGLSSAPQNLQATGGDSNITLSWEAPDLDGGSPITKYRIYKSTIQGEEVLFDEIEDFLEYTDTYVNDDATYYYTVSAVNLVGVGPQSNEANAMTLIVPPTPSTPSVPHNLQAQSGDSYVYLTWDVPTLDGGSTITNYRVYRGVEEDDLEVIALIGNVPHYNDTNVTKDVVYYYKVSAVNLIGEGPLSDDVNASYQEESITEVPPGDEDGESMWWLWILIIIIIVIVVLVFLFLYWRDRKKEEQAPPKQGPPGSQ